MAKTTKCNSSMPEREWVKSLIPKLQKALPKYKVEAEKTLPYTCDVREYQLNDDNTLHVKANGYKTDILIYEENGTCWTPRVVIEAKIKSINSHTAIAYSQKASTHKNIHPYLRYGIFIGNRGDKALPGRLFRHGSQFDFMVTWDGCNPSKKEWKKFIDLISAEIEASKQLEELLYEARNKDRNKYSILHRPLVVSE